LPRSPTTRSRKFSGAISTAGTGRSRATWGASRRSRPMTNCAPPPRLSLFSNCSVNAKAVNRPPFRTWR
jgi:hypothetical protein